jgi:acetyltransferase-like isoleucine patch superfamily enzyme
MPALTQSKEAPATVPIIAGPLISHPDRVDGLDRVRSIATSARLTVLDPDEASASKISLGHDVYIGRDVELTAAGGGNVWIDDDTSIQDCSIIFGNVKIGAHCLFGKYTFIASRGHCFRDRPPWLIRDQDRLFLPRLAPPEVLAKGLVRIEDDCWISQSVVVSPGVYIGRGAIVGANTVVTSDIGPYEIHGGTPNRKIGERLIFAPPLAIQARDDNAIPYFYRGFRLTQEALGRSRKDGVVEARANACIVLAASSSARLRLTGLRYKHDELVLRLRVNGIDRGEHSISTGPFEISADVPMGAATDIPAPLRKTTVIEIATSPVSAEQGYGIASATLAHG